MSKDFVQSQLDAGGLVNLNSACDLKTTEKIVARTYGAPVLGDRVVVKLSSDRLVPAEDLAMEFLGLAGRAVSDPLALQTRTALDFAHWALIHQPKHAKFALDLVKRMKATARKAASKPGAAWDLYTAMADDLNKSVRDLLPPFWEQVARTFKEIGNQTYAGRGLNKALEAERVHALKVNREHRRDAVLEFALSGCLSGKALTDYAKDLEKQFAPADAYETFKDLVVRRTLGGMPPISNVATDLNRMAKAAKLDASAELEAILETIITSPSMARASIQFWKSLKQPIAKIVHRNKSFAAWLIVHTNPQSSYRTDSPVWQWIDLLDEWGVLPMVWQPPDKWPQDVELPGGRVGWISSILSVETSPNKRVFELLESMAEVLRDEAKPITFTYGYYGAAIDVDVLETCLDLELEVKLASNFDLNFDGWLRSDVDHPRRNSQLAKIAADARFAKKLNPKVADLIGFNADSPDQRSSWSRNVALRRSFDEAAAGHPVVREAWWNYLDKQLNALETGGLVDVEAATNVLINCVRPKSVAEFPQLIPRMQKIDFAKVLQRTLNAGVFDEYGWPELDKAADATPLHEPAGRYDRPIYPVFPRLAYFQNGFIHVIDAERRAKPRELKLTQGDSLLVAVPVGDDVMIAVQSNSAGWVRSMRWLSEPNEVFVQDDANFHGVRGESASVPFGDGEYFFGARTVRPGDTQWPKADCIWFHDGSRFWCLKKNVQYWADEGDDVPKAMLAELDPKTGKELRDSVPPFFEESLPSGGKLLWHLSCLLPLPKQTGNSPLGSKDGLIGWRVVRRRDGSCEGLGVDGRKWVTDVDDQNRRGVLVATAMIDKPGTKSYWVLDSDGKLIDGDSRIAFGFYGEKLKYAVGQPTTLPKLFLHLMRVRCETSSQQLRRLTNAQAGSLFDAAIVEHEALKRKVDAEKPDADRTAATKAVAKLLPQAPPRLLMGVARIARIAAEEALSLQSILKRVLPDPDAKKTAAATFDAQRADAGFQGLSLGVGYGLSHSYFHPGQPDEHSISANIIAVGKFLSGTDERELPPCMTRWLELLNNLPSLAWTYFWKIATNESLGTTVAERLQTPWLDALACLADSKLLGLKEKLYLYSATAARDQNEKPGSVMSQLELGKQVAFVEGSNRFVAFLVAIYPHNTVAILGYSPQGKPKPPQEFNIASTIELVPGWNRHSLLSFIKGTREVKSLPLPSAEQLATAAQQLGVHPIAVALTWMGGLRTVPYGQEKLTKELRDFYGWKVKEIQVALAELNSLEIPPTVSSIGIRNNPGGAMLDGRDRAFDQMVKLWAEPRKKVVQLPAELAKKLEFGRHRHQAIHTKLLSELLANPHDSDLLRRRQVSLAKETEGFELIETHYEPPVKIEPADVYPGLLRSLNVINYELPVAAEARLALPAVIEAIRAFIDDPSTLFRFGARLTTPTPAEVNIDSTVAALSTAITKLEPAPDGLFRGDSGLIVVATLPPAIGLLFRSARLVDEKTKSCLIAAAILTHEFWGPAVLQMDVIKFVLTMRSEAMTQLANDNRNVTLPAGSWEQDPRLSVPETVQQCMKKLDVSESATALYLQILALHDPTTANVKRWNQWTPKQYAAAADELTAAQQVVNAKRERAGREIFLPGGWEPLKAPNLPIESWKLKLFGHDNTDRLRGGAAEVLCCEGSIASKFRCAWQRVQSGDVPKYEEANTKKKKR